jgi:transposase
VTRDSPEARFAWLAPAALWPYAEPLLPAAPVRPQGGGAPRTDEQALFAAVVYVVVTGSPWRALPRVFGVSWQNSHRRFVQWTNDGLWGRMRDAVAQVGTGDLYGWADQISDRARLRLRESTAADATPEPPPTGSAAGLDGQPAVRKMHRTLAERLFGPLG